MALACESLSGETSARPASAAAGFAFSGGRMGRPRKAGPRKPCGRLKEIYDHGHESTLARRAALVGEEHQGDNRAAYPLGVLWLRGLLADPGLSGQAAEEQAKARHDAGLAYARDYIIVWGGA